MALFQWKEEYSVSVPRFDADHKRLFSLLDELNDAVAEGRGRSVVLHTLQQLAEYTRVHFAAEEAAMRSARCPGLEEHIAEHRALSAKVERFFAEFSAHNAGLPVEVLYFLNAWLERHTLHTDRKYSETLNRAGFR